MSEQTEAQPAPKRRSRRRLSSAVRRLNEAVLKIEQREREARGEGYEGFDESSRRPDPKSEHARRIEAHFQDVKAFAAAAVDRSKLGLLHREDFTFGYTSPGLVEWCLELVEAGPDDVFYDLGSGVGQAALTAAGVCRRACGIELLPSLHETAVEAARELGVENVDFRCEDLLACSFDDATLLFAYAPCWGDELLQAISKKIGAAAAGTRVIFVGTEIPPQPRLHLERRLLNAWSAEGEEVMRMSVFIYRLGDAAEPSTGGDAS